MHIPDGFLSNRIWIAFDALSGAGILYAARRVHIEASARLIPMMGVLSAFVFAAQLLNFPVLGGTSGHLVGGALLAILLGPLAGFLTMATVVTAQALFLQDGGLAALGANIFNLGAVTTFGGYAVFTMLAGRGEAPRRLALASFLAGWASLMLSATCCVLELALSGAVPVKMGLVVMAGYHAIIGLAEGGLTAGIMVFISRNRPDLIRAKSGQALRLVDWAAALVFIALPVAILGLAGSSSLPDPLQRLLASPAEISQPEGEPLLSPTRFRDYFRGAAIIGCGIVVAYLVARWSQGRNPRS